MLHGIRSRLTYANVVATGVMATGALFLALGGGAYALSGVPDRSGAYHGCVDPKTGGLRVVRAASNCRKTETVRRGGRRVRILGESAIAWNQHGRQGIQGVAHVKWTDYVTAAGALGFIFVVAVGVIQIGRARKAEAAQWAMETKKEWAQDLGGVRWKVAEHGKTPDALRDKLKELWEANHPDYYELLRELQYWDRVGFLVRRGSLSRSALHALTGPDAAFRWSLWQPAVEEFLRKEPPGGLGFSNAYNQFQFLAEKRSAKHLHEYEDVQPPHTTLSTGDLGEAPVRVGGNRAATTD